MAQTYQNNDIRKHLIALIEHEHGLFGQPVDPEADDRIAQLRQLLAWVERTPTTTAVQTWDVNLLATPVELLVDYQGRAQMRATAGADEVIVQNQP